MAQWLIPQIPVLTQIASWAQLSRRDLNGIEAFPSQFRQNLANLFEGEVQGMEDCAWLQWTVVLVVTHLFDVVVMESSLFRGFRAV